MKRIAFATIVALLATSCKWGLGELRGWDAKAREVSNKQICEQVEVIQAEELPPPVQKAVEVIKERAEDEIDRAKVAQEDHGYKPKERVELGSEKDNYMFNAYSGASQAKVQRRKVVRAIVHKVTRLLSVFKWLWRLLPYAVVALIVIWIRREFFKRDTVTVKHIQATVSDKEARRKISSGSPVQRAYRKTRP